MLVRGEQAASAEGLELTWRTADAEHLPFADASFDVAMSCIGVMFAPHHQSAADELLRVVRPGGRVAVLSWTPEGFIGQLFATMKPFAPAPPPGASPAPLWGRADHVRGLFGDRTAGFNARQATLRVTAFDSGAQLRDYFKSHYGPTIAVYRSLGEDRARIDALDQALSELGDGAISDGAMDWEYLLVTARRA